MQKSKSTLSKIVLLYVVVLLISGCAPPQKTVTITTDPNAARIYINGQDSGITPLTKKLLFDKEDRFEVLAKKEGYQDGEITIRLEPKDKTDYPIALKKIESVPIELVSIEPQPTDRGIKLGVVRKPTLAYLEVIERSPNVRSVTRITNNQDPTLQIGAPILSPVEDILVYQTIEETKTSSYSNIWKMTIGSFGQTRVTYGKSRDSFPSFTPDGQQIVFSSNRTSKNQTLWRIRLGGGGGITNITNTLSEDFSPFVAPKNEIIAYTSIPPDAEEPQIWTISANGSLPTQLREGEVPNISPDGKKILFIRPDKTTGKKQIWVMNIDGSEETQLTQNVDRDTMDPKWSPDGQWIVFSCDEGLDSEQRQNYDIWLMAADGSKKTQLTTNGSRDDSPCWDRTGKFIYFRSNRGGIWNIWRFEPIMP